MVEKKGANNVDKANGTTDKPSKANGTTDKPSKANGTTDKPSKTTDKINDKPSKATDKVNDKPNKANGTTDKAGDKSLVKTETVEVKVPTSIPKGALKLEKLQDGFKLSGLEERTTEGKFGISKSSHTFCIEQRYGSKVEEVKGELSGEGKYSVKLRFVEN